MNVGKGNLWFEVFVKENTKKKNTEFVGEVSFWHYVLRKSFKTLEEEEPKYDIRQIKA